MKAAEWVTRADPSGLLYGAIVSAAVLVTVSAHAEDTDHVILATSVFLVVYWMAHVYIETLSTQFRGDQKPFASHAKPAKASAVAATDPR